MDSAYTRQAPVNQLLALENEGFLEAVNTTAFGANSGMQHADVCAVLGPVSYAGHAGLSPLTEAWNIPQVAYATLDHKLSRDDWFPNFVRLVPTGTHFGETMPQALSNQLADTLMRRSYIANIYEEDYGEQFENPVEDAEDVLEDYHTLTESYTPGDQESLPEALAYATDEVEGYRTVLLTIDQWSMMDDIAATAVDLGIVGEGYVWAVTVDALAQLDTLELEPGAPLDELLNGMAVFTNYDRFFYRPDDSNFLQAWRAQQATDVQHVLGLQPLQGKAFASSPFVPTLPDDYFAKNDPVHYASFMYDAVMATGLAACVVQQDASLTHVEAMKRLEFTGASGPVQFEKDDDSDDGDAFKSDRDPSGVMFGLHNVQSVTQPNGKHKYVEKNDRVSYVNVCLLSQSSCLLSQSSCSLLSRYELKLVAIYETIGGEGAWTRNDEKFFFYGGMTTEPAVQISPNKFNYLTQEIQAVGFILVGVSLVVALGSGLWVFVHRNERAIKPSQPEFLLMMCVGAALVAVSLVFISYDEGKEGWDKDRLSKACVAFPWFFILGYEVMYCALVCKLWRLSKVMQMRRRKVTIYQVILPFAGVTVCILALMTVWTIHDPLKWDREIVGEDPRNTYGECSMDSHLSSYLAPLGFLVFSAMAATATLCWQLRDVQSDLAESRWIFLGIFAHLQLWAIGIPLLIIADDVSRDVSYIMTAALCFVFSTTLVTSVIWPKIWNYYRGQYFTGASPRKVTVNTSGKTSTRVSGLVQPSIGDMSRSMRHGEESAPVILDAEVRRAPPEPADEPEQPEASDSNDF